MADDARNPEITLRAEDMLRFWGWTNPPPNVTAQAEIAAKLQSMDPVQIIVALKILPQERVDQFLDECPPTQMALEFIAQNDANVRARMDQILSLQAGIHYSDLAKEHFSVHPQLEADRELAKEARKLSAALFLLDGDTTVIAFATMSGLREFKTRTGLSRDRTRLYEQFADARLFIGPREAIDRALKEVGANVEDVSEPSVKVLHSATLQRDEKSKLIDDWHQTALRAGSDDIHTDVLPNNTVTLRMRLHTVVRDMPLSATISEYQAAVNFLVVQSDADRSGANLREPKDGRYQYLDQNGNVVNVRASFIPTPHIRPNGIPAVSVRLRLQRMTDGEVNLADRGIREDVLKILRAAVRPTQGLIILAGPTNTGKSTTIAGMIAEHRRIYGDTKARLSAEDPVERFMPGVNQFEVPAHLRGKGFSAFVRAFMRHDPDVVIPGEIRDEETAEATVHFADTGHLVFSTVHATRPSQAVQRLVNMLPSDKAAMRQSLVENLVLVLGQRLLPRLCECAEWQDSGSAEQEQLDFIAKTRGFKLELPARHRVAKGCPKCHNSGFTGKVPINEALVLTDTIRERILAPGAGMAREAMHGVDVSFESMALDYIKDGRVAFDSLNF